MHRLSCSTPTLGAVAPRRSVKRSPGHQAPEPNADDNSDAASSLPADQPSSVEAGEGDIPNESQSRLMASMVRILAGMSYGLGHLDPPVFMQPRELPITSSRTIVNGDPASSSDLPEPYERELKRARRILQSYLDRYDQIVDGHADSANLDSNALGVKSPPKADMVRELFEIVESPGDQASREQYFSQLRQAAAQGLPGEAIIEASEPPADDVRREALSTALAGVAVKYGEIEYHRAALDQLVAEARRTGASWSDIGRAAGITPQAAHRRWDPAARRKHSDYQRQAKNSTARPVLDVDSLEPESRNPPS